jgi:hypothetical protein
VAQTFGIVAQLGGETASPQCDRAGHRLLHVGVTGQLDRALARSEIVQRLRDRRHPSCELAHRILQVQPQRREHLIVARTSEVHALAGVADARDQQILERRLSILVLEPHVPFAARMLGCDLAQTALDRRKIFGAQQPLCMQHLGVRDRCAHVIGDQSVVERVIFAGRVTQHTLVETRALVPQPAHVSCAARQATAR